MAEGQGNILAQVQRELPQFGSHAHSSNHHFFSILEGKKIRPLNNQLILLTVCKILHLISYDTP